MSSKKKVKTQRNFFVALLAIVVIVGLVVGFNALNVADEDSAIDKLTKTLEKTGNCPDTGLTAFKFDVSNLANETANEGFDGTVYVYQKVDDTETLFTTITDTTTPNSTDLECNANYIAKMISTSGASGDSSYVTSVTGGDAVVVDGAVEFSTMTSTAYLKVKGEQHASLECRAYDMFNAEYLYDTSDSSALDYETDNATFTSTTSNTTASDEANGLALKLNCRAVQKDTNYDDRGTLILVENPVAIWEKPTVKVNGQMLENVKGTVVLTPSESIKYTDYEYIYLIPQGTVIKDGGAGVEITVESELLSGVSAVTADPQVDLAPRGQFLSIDGVTVKVGAVTDASSPVQVHTLYDVGLEMT